MAKRLPVMEDLLRIHSLADPSFCAGRVAWTVCHWDTRAPEGFRRFRRVVHTALLRASGLEEEQILTAGGGEEGCATVMPDGAVCFLSDASRPLPMPEVGTVPKRLENEFFGQRQLYRCRGGRTEKMTSLRHGVEDYIPSPDGEKILLLSWKYGEETLEQLVRERTAEEIRAELQVRLSEPYTTESQRFKADAEMGYCAHRSLELWLWEQGQLRLLPVQPFSAPCWMPDGKTILFQRGGRDNLLEFHTMDVETGAVALLATLTNVSPCYEEHAPLITQGQIIFCANTPNMEYSDPRGLYAIPAAGGEKLEARRLISEEADVDGVLPQEYSITLRNERRREICLVGEDVYYTTGLDGDVRIAAVPAMASQAVPRRVTAPMETYRTLHPVDENHVLALCGLPDRMPELALVELSTGRGTLLTNANPWQEEVALQKPQSIHTPSGVQGFYLPPVTGEAKAPVIVYCHGGPTGFYASNLDYEFQALAAAGYGVLYPNPRSSTGFGKEYGADHFAYDGASLADVEEFLDTACALDPRLDAGRAGVCGGSYGGFLTLYAAVHSDKFRAACAHRALANMHMIATATHSAGGHSREEYPDLVRCLTARLEESISPLVDKISIPLLLLYSESDANCIPAQGYQIYAAMKAWKASVPCEFILYPDSCHGLGYRGPMELAVHHKNANREWFDRYLR